MKNFPHYRFIHRIDIPFPVIYSVPTGNMFYADGGILYLFDPQA